MTIVTMIERKQWPEKERLFGSHSFGRLLLNGIVQIGGIFAGWRFACLLLFIGLFVAPIAILFLVLHLFRIEKSVSDERTGRSSVHFRPERLVPDLPQPVRILFDSIQFAVDRMTFGVRTVGLKVDCFFLGGERVVRPGQTLLISFSIMAGMIGWLE